MGGANEQNASGGGGGGGGGVNPNLAKNATVTNATPVGISEMNAGSTGGATPMQAPTVVVAVVF